LELAAVAEAEVAAAVVASVLLRAAAEAAAEVAEPSCRNQSTRAQVRLPGQTRESEHESSSHSSGRAILNA